VDDGRKGGLARVETLRKQIARKNPHTLFLFAGDTLSPSVASSFFRGQQMIDFTLACSYFLRKGGCGYTMLQKVRGLSDADDSPAESVVIYEELSKRKSLHPNVEGRIKVSR